ncbi:MAG: HAMP domain-containing protein [Elusimicrobia bacterium]|nr:HAMP domain-containing protein [Elusimicrobiota bacterium]
MRLFHRFFLLILAASLIPLAAVSGLLLLFQRNARANAFRLHQSIGAFAARATEQHLASLNQRLAFIAAIGEAGDPGTELRVAHEAVATNRDLFELAVLDASGKALMRAGGRSRPGAPSSEEERALLSRALRTKRLARGAVALRGRRPVWTLAFPLARARAALVALDMSGLWETLQSGSGQRAGAVALVQADGAVLPGFGAALGAGAPAFLTRTLAAAKPGAAEPGLSLDGLPLAKGPGVGALEPVSGTDWYAMSVQPSSEAFSGASDLATAAAALLAILAAVSFLFAYISAAGVSSPLEKLAQAAGRIARRDFSQALPPLGSAEMEAVRSSFNSMMGEMGSYHKLQIDRILAEKARIETLVATLPDAILMTDSEGRAEYLNALAGRLLGIRPSDSAETVTRAMVRTAKPKETVAFGEGPEVRHFMPFVASCVQGERRVGTLLLLQDVTIMKNLDQMKDNFLSMITHDLRNPLSSAIGCLDLLAIGAKTLTAQQNRLIAIMQNAMSYLSELVDNILDLSKIEAGRMTYSPQWIDARDLTEGVEGILRPRAAQFKVELDISRVPPGAQAWVDAQALKRVIANLVGNALRFTPIGGKVWVEWTAGPAGSCRMAVRDTGIGIPKDKLHTLFRKFAQVEETKSQARDAKGTGLGLAICREVVEGHRGKIWVESEYGKGTAFVFTLPGEGVESDSPSSQPSPASRSS